MPFTTFDVWDQALLTDVIARPPDGRAPGAAEDSPLLGEKIAPNKDLAGREAKIRVQEIKPFGKGQFRAPDATPALFKPAVTWTDTIVELLLLDEMERISEEDWLKLNSGDENIARSAGVSLVDRGKILKLRNDRLTEYMRWQMLTTGKLSVTYPATGSTLAIDFGYTTGHLPTAGTLWSSVTTADPVADIQSWVQLLADDSGFYGRHLIMNSVTFDYLIRNTNIKNAVNFYASGSNNILRPRKTEILNLFETFAQDVDIIIYDNGYRDVGASGVGRPSLTKYLPNGKVLVTTDFSIDGHNIADTLDGQVTVSSGYNSVSIRQGWQAEVMLDHLSKTHFLRSASARMPRMLIPEAVLCATVA